MLHFDRWKIIAIIGTCLLGLLIALPNFVSKESLAGWPDYMPKRQMPLGLDLQGGAHLLYAMDTAELKKDWLLALKDDARKQLRDAKIGFSAIGVQGDVAQVRLVKPEDSDKALVELRKLIQPVGNAILGNSGFNIEVAAGSEPGVFTLKPTSQGIQERVQSAIGASIDTINRRINGLGTSESTVVQQGRDRILIQYPGLTDIEKLKKLVGETAKLTFHEVNANTSVEEAKSSHVPLGYKIVQSSEKEDEPGSAREYLISESVIVAGDDLVDAQPSFDQQTNAPIIAFRFNQSGALKFGEFTSKHVGEPFAAVLDDKVVTAPRIISAIRDGSGQITGNFTVESANDLAIKLRSGSLPAKLTIKEERSVGPSLGADSIASGKTAGIVGLLATAILTVLAYGTFGVYAVIGLLVHGIMVAALMTLVGTTLTLPGIAGFVLTIAMAVDANVLIYERIREELRAKKSPIAAIDAGFNRAFVTIVDSQLTTLAAAIIMFWLGSGPIRGFAVTLTLGILTSVFAAVTITRLLVSLWLKDAKPRSRTINVPV
ncbi:MAG: protein translocase subunit SecD [Hyphomicrobium sp.]